MKTVKVYLEINNSLITHLETLFGFFLLRYLIKFLAKVTEHSELNKMNASNLAIVFGPNLLWSSNENR